MVSADVGERSKPVVLDLKQPIRGQRAPGAAGAAWAETPEAILGGRVAEACWWQAQARSYPHRMDGSKSTTQNDAHACDRIRRSRGVPSDDCSAALS